jgi:membrane-bound lytic murein transglycosylase MltF
VAARDNDETPPWLRDYQPLEVDLSTLTQFAKVLHDEVELNFRPHAKKLLDSLDPGPAAFVPKDGFFELLAAGNQYTYCRDQAIRLLVAYADATEQLATAADAIGQRYRDTDQLAAAQLTDIDQAFTNAAPGTTHA